MKFTVIQKSNLKYVRGSKEMKYKYLIEGSNGDKYFALNWTALAGKPVVYDIEFDAEVMSNGGWTLTGYGYIHNNKFHMHTLIADIANVGGVGPTIDHINGYKLDNRSKNLRRATQADQNANRPARADKIAPCEELQEAGVTELPRYVRWDHTEKKFVIDKHPHLLKEVVDGVRKKAIMSGSKSRTLSITAKFQDILARLKALDEAIWSADKVEFQRLKEENTKEYEEICKCIEVYEGRYVEPPEIEDIVLPPIEPVKRTCAGKKTISRLPENCGVKHEDIPKYCYYHPKTDKRGDYFTIDKHPYLVKEGKRQWSTTQMSNVSTHEKFVKLMAKYEEFQELLG